MAHINAIQTEYNGYKFRSRTEARWAVFMDALKVKYIYEEEGFELGDGIRYLPDFYLPKLKCYIEIKGDEPNDEEMDKCWMLCKETARTVVIISGVPGDGWREDGEPGNRSRNNSHVYHNLIDAVNSMQQPFIEHMFDIGPTDRVLDAIITAKQYKFGRIA